jgi:hypothetical protein
MMRFLRQLRSGSETTAWCAGTPPVHTKLVTCRWPACACMDHHYIIRIDGAARRHVRDALATYMHAWARARSIDRHDEAGRAFDLPCARACSSGPPMDQPGGVPCRRGARGPCIVPAPPWSIDLDRYDWIRDGDGSAHPLRRRRRSPLVCLWGLIQGLYLSLAS